MGNSITLFQSPVADNCHPNYGKHHEEQALVKEEWSEGESYKQLG
jgi:hypothetical protein